MNNKQIDAFISRFKQQKSSSANILNEIRGLLQELVVGSYLDKLTELKTLLQNNDEANKNASATPEAIQAAELDGYLDPKSEKFQTSLKNLKSIASKKTIDSKICLVLYRPCADTEFDTCKDPKTSRYNTQSLSQGKGMNTSWYASQDAANGHRTKKNPLVQAYIPEESIIGFMFPAGGESTPLNPAIDDKWVDVIEVSVKPGEYTIISEYLGDY